jgi:hypothetical protein
MKENGKGMNSNIIYLIHCKNFCKCPNILPPSTTTKKNGNESNKKQSSLIVLASYSNTFDIARGKGHSRSFRISLLFFFLTFSTLSQQISNSIHITLYSSAMHSGRYYDFFPYLVHLYHFFYKTFPFPCSPKKLKRLFH